MFDWKSLISFTIFWKIFVIKAPNSTPLISVSIPNFMLLAL